MEDQDIVPTVQQALVFGGIGLCSVATLGCMWCRRKWRRFKQYRLQVRLFPPSSAFSPNRSEFSTFSQQPVGQLTSVRSVPAAVLDQIVFEPLPEIRSRNLQAVAQNVHPARFTGLSEKISLQDWFDESRPNFPRNQLKYLREVGSSWYGQAVEGEAYNILPGVEKTRVVVKILRADAEASECMQFLNEARPFRDLQSPYLLRVIGRCLDAHPFLLIMEHSYLDLKSYLIHQRKSPEMLLKDGLFLHIACSIASGIQYMQEHGYIHCDIAAHSCVVTSDLSVKIGDYGTALYTHKSDYYCLGDIAFPLRWCAPESLNCTESNVEAKAITKEANVWSVGVILWELLEFGKLPYMDLSDDEVVQKVILGSSIEYPKRLEQPKTPCLHKDFLYRIMELCWLPPSHRPSMQKVATLLNYLYENRNVLSGSAAFEARWNALQPVIPSHKLRRASASASFRFESDFDRKKDRGLPRDCDSIMSSECSHHQFHDKSLSHCSLSAGCEGGLLMEVSPSLQNFRGSIGDLSPSASVNEEICVEPYKCLSVASEDPDFKKSISEAIRDLDIMLANEVPSSEASTCTTPERSPHESTSRVHKKPIVVKAEVNIMNGNDSNH